MESFVHILLTLGPAIAIAALLGGSRGITLRRARKASCASCWYPVEGLTGTTCPECGNDLTGRGTLAPGERVVVRSFPLAASGGTVVLAIPTVMGLLWCMESYPRVASTASATATSRSGSFSIAIAGEGAEDVPWSHGVLSSAVGRPHTKAAIRTLEKTTVLEIVNRRRHANFDDNGRRRRTSDGLTAEDVADWMRSAGIPARDSLDPEVVAVYTLISNVAGGGGPLVVAIGTGSLTGLDDIVMQSDRRRTVRPLLCAAVLLTAFGLWLLALRSLRRSINGSTRRRAP